MGVKDEQDLLDERMALEAERGEWEPVPGSRPTYRKQSDPALTRADLMAIFEGRPRGETPQPAKKTWRVRTTDLLDEWAEAGAEEEHVGRSALIRKAVQEYLATHHASLFPAV
ncbi:hypothetical protein CRD60_04510 [Bifidobacterium aemilianum]|uniref:Ribbon-helix-helix protein CopG domain-containing protein n=1 Tax=Bifidobacterium aemilianum TaxID=2493120 RepID=A0A366K9Q2_9BIFI|nr:hypothetical protein [Bifidobacterium aemilianum]RBP97853.1 hypothetical protein CRD60_04510 [Bifidobacterium aemilianum]